MYTNEIYNYLQERNWTLENYDEFYDKIFKTSPQIAYVGYNDNLHRDNLSNYTLSTKDGLTCTIWIKDKYIQGKEYKKEGSY